MRWRLSECTVFLKRAKCDLHAERCQTTLVREDRGVLEMEYLKIETINCGIAQQVTAPTSGLWLKV